MPDTRESLTAAYSLFLQSRGFTDAGSADELVLREGINADNRRWLYGFIQRWEAMEDAERERGRTQ